MFRIGEFSTLTQISVRMLRYYDETGLLKPAHIDRFTGYRMYSVEQLPILHRIVFLRDTGFNVSEIADALSNWNSEYISLQLKKKKYEINTIIEQELEKITKIDIARDDIFNEKISIHCNITLKSIPSHQVLSLRRVIPDYYKEGKLWQELFAYVEAHHIHIIKNCNDFAIYHDTDYKDADVDVEVCVIVDHRGEASGDFIYYKTEPIDIVACAMVTGPYENIGTAYESFAHWLIEHNQYQMLGKNRQICHRGPWNETVPDRYLTEIQLPVKKRVDL
jgi:DNA-binding transcriptional MerR regulator